MTDALASTRTPEGPRAPCGGVRAGALAITFVAVLTTHLGAARAERPQSCGGAITRTSAVSCALAASLTTRAERQGVSAAEGRRVAATPFFPSNPVVSFEGSRRSIAGFGVFNWSASLSQEIEVGGQRGARIDAAAEQLNAQRKRVVAAERDVASTALVAYYDVLAGEEEARLATRLESVARAVAVVARARADKGVSSEVDAQVADAAGVRAASARIAADQHLRAVRETLATLLGDDPSSPVSVTGDLTPWPGIDIQARAAAMHAAADRPDVLALEAERRALESRATMYRRARLPNPTLSAFVQNDDLNDRIVGFGISLPIPLPQPVGRTYAGEIAESEALAERTRTEAEQKRRDVRLEVAKALDAYDARLATAAAYTPERVAHADRSLQVIAQEIESGRLAVRDAVVAQQSLIELLLAHIEVRRALCVAAVDLAHAAGVPLETLSSS